MEILKPTVKRDISLFSVLAWQKGYTDYLKKFHDFWYDIFFWYDGEKVCCYHRLADFTHFKETVTAKLIADNDLFARLNRAFLSDAEALEKALARPGADNLSEIFDLYSRLMSFYIFVVSDKFNQAQPAALSSRLKSEALPYTVDEQVEKLARELLSRADYDVGLARYLTKNEILMLADKPGSVDCEQIRKRRSGYIIFNDELITDMSFAQYCQKHELDNPEDREVVGESEVVKGQMAYAGNARGKVRIVNRKEDLGKVQKGDILVTTMTNTTYLLAMKKAAAIITDEGGVICHAAIVAREMKKPCLVGTKTATRILHDGDEVEIDGRQGTFRKINKSLRR